MQKINISHTQSGYLNRLMLDYIADSELTKSFYNKRVSISNLIEAAKPESFQHIDRAVLEKVLLDQNKDLNLSDATKNNILLFKEEYSFCIVTAHQLNIYTGPLYVIYKIVSTIIACRELQLQTPEKNFIPVFVLGSEDHDLAEINHFNLFGKTYTWNSDSTGVCGRMPTTDLQEITNSLSSLFKGNTMIDELLTIFNKAYNGTYTLAHATRIILNALFGKYGLVIIDSDDARLKAKTIDIITEELLNQSSFKLVSATNEKLQQHYKEQAHAREINLFYVVDGIRERIVYDLENELYSVLNTDLQFTKESILQIVNDNPERFSPNVILRPLFQQRILPALAYVGGGGELSYWLQLKSVFELYRIPFPALMLRNSVLLIDKNTQKKLQKLNLELTDFFEEEDSLIKKYILENTDKEISLEQEKLSIEELYKQLREKVNAIDTTLEKSVSAEMQNAINALQKLEAKLLKSQKNKSETEINQIRAVREKLFPGGIPQERFDNVISRYSIFGDDFFEILIDNLNPFSPDLTVLFED
ncbi:MAG: bacillithiol biosynthesis cysteine-adding enzyme BshC [Chitinophagales bacterium]|nr:bacillithiol biosynthesis cysteine-adding enzyme BshC [Bacteroidota bacterium]MBP9548370.1 bacillithiol biosynthesis cysteine-adding enzyme BshC [Chitinophagales bacterium]MBP9705245.1 bacillithiol biosynthesis cysteine-adding enzyme BshC [Chitinophagales bacterium]